MAPPRCPHPSAPGPSGPGFSRPSGEPGLPGHDPLWTLAQRLHALAADSPTESAVVVAFPGSAGTPATHVEWIPLDDGHPLDVLLGFRAPEHCSALGVCSPGSERGTEADFVRVTLLVDRSGATACLLQRATGTTPLPGPPEGLVADACRRALGLATGPPPPCTTELWLLVWLDRIVAEVSAHAPSGGRHAAWSRLAALHPGWPPGTATGPLEGDSAVDDTAVQVVQLVAATQALARAWPWSRLRADPAGVDLPGVAALTPLAGWMDDGMWARWVLASLPGLADLLDAVHALLPPRLAEPVTAVVGAALADERR